MTAQPTASKCRAQQPEKCHYHRNAALAERYANDARWMTDKGYTDDAFIAARKANEHRDLQTAVENGDQAAIEATKTAIDRLNNPQVTTPHTAATTNQPAPTATPTRASFRKWLGLDTRGFTETRLPTGREEGEFSNLPLDGYNLPADSNWEITHSRITGRTHLWIKDATTGKIAFAATVKQTPASIERAAPKLQQLQATINDLGLTQRALTAKYPGDWYVDLLQANITNSVYVSYRRGNIKRTAHIPLNKKRAEKLLDRLTDITT